MEKLNNHSEKERQGANDWSILEDMGEFQGPRELATDEEIRQARQRNVQLDKDLAPEQAKRAVEDMMSIEQNFAKLLAQAPERALNKKEFELWENDLADDWSKHLKELERTTEDHFVSPEMQATCEHDYILATRKLGEKSVEVQAAKFYTERSEALADAISASEDKNKEQDFRTVGQLFHFAEEHLRYKYRSVAGMDVAEATRYYNDRERAHNRLIKHFNAINDLALKYGVRPLTPRNFWTSEGSQKNPDVQDRMRLDRNQVEMYCQIAFSATDEELRRRWERERNLY